MTPDPYLEPPDRREERQLGELVRRLADEGGMLVRQEIELAKLEVRRSLAGLGRASVFVGLGILLLVIGLVVLLVFAILALGTLLGGEYWLSSLIIGGILAAIGAILLLVGRRGLARGEVRPRTTIRTAVETKDWARDEARQLKQDLGR